MSPRLAVRRDGRLRTSRYRALQLPVLVWLTERHAHGTDIHGFGDAIFFSTVQLLTISSQLKNPLTAAGRVVDVGLQVWAIVVVASIGGSFAAFFASGDRN